WSRCVRARHDSLLAQFANVPVLFVRHVPKLDRVLRIKILSLERVGMKQPVADDQRPFRRLWPELMNHDVFGMQAQQHVRENQKKKNLFETLNLASEPRAGVSTHGQAFAGVDSHETAEKGAFM